MRYIVAFIVFMNASLFGLVTVLTSAQDPTPEPPPPLIDIYPIANTNTPFGATQRYVTGDRWNKTNLTYTFIDCPRSLNCEDAYTAVRRAFQRWDEVSGLAISESNGSADIEITFRLDDSEFDGDVLAFAYFPSDGGDVFFNDQIEWTLYDGDGNDFYVVALHEIGHALGLDHSFEGTVMYAYSEGGVFDLTEDDIAGIQTLYGEGDDIADNNTDTNTNTNTMPDLVGALPEINTPDNWTESEETTGDTVTGSLDDENYYEAWSIDVQEGETVTVTMQATSGDLEPYLYLVTTDWEDILTESTYSDETDARLSYTFDETGTFDIIATTYDEDMAGEYTLSVSYSTDNANPNETLVTVENESGFEVCELYISPTTDENWGDNLVDVLADGDFIELQFADGEYDVAFATCDGEFFEEYGIELFGDALITLTDDGIR
jgi:hypothetical protein